MDDQVREGSAIPAPVATPIRDALAEADPWALIPCLFVGGKTFGWLPLANVPSSWQVENQVFSFNWRRPADICPSLRHSVVGDEGELGAALEGFQLRWPQMEPDDLLHLLLRERPIGNEFVMDASDEIAEMAFDGGQDDVAGHSAPPQGIEMSPEPTARVVVTVDPRLFDGLGRLLAALEGRALPEQVLEAIEGFLQLTKIVAAEGDLSAAPATVGSRGSVEGDPGRSAAGLVVHL